MLGPRDRIVRQRDRGNEAQGVSQGTIVTHHCSERHPTHEEDEDKVERGHLLSRTPARDPDHQDEETVSDNRPENTRHTLILDRIPWRCIHGFMRIRDVIQGRKVGRPILTETPGQK